MLLLQIIAIIAIIATQIMTLRIAPLLIMIAFRVKRNAHTAQSAAYATKEFFAQEELPH